MKGYNTDDIIYSLATAWGKAAIAVIRVSGDGCIAAVAPTFHCKKGLQNYQSNKIVYGDLAGIDRCMISVFKNGNGYTGEEALEISCHGGLQTVKLVLEHLQSLGFRQAQRGEFTLRAFLKGRMDLTKAEAVNELINSQGRTGAMLALNRLDGSLFNSVAQIKSIVTDILSTVEVQLDYAEDEIDQDLAFPMEKLEQAVDMARRLSRSYRTGKLYSQGAMVVLAGSTNAGKSSLFNYFLKEDRSIVSNIKGTTRDYIESSCVIDSIPVRLFDTAGLRESSDEIETQGIERSRNLLETADLIIYMVDASDPHIDLDIVKDPRTICVLNKVDLYRGTPAGLVNPVLLSVKEGTGFDTLCERISDRLRKDVEAVDQSVTVIENTRQKQDLDRAVEALENAASHVEASIPLDIVTMDIQEALEALGEITGEVTTDDILDRIFENFCVGK